MKMSSFSFPGLGNDSRPDEHVVATIHKHWWALLREMVGIALLFLAPFIVIPFIGALLGSSGNAAQLGAVVGFLGSLWALICWQLLFARWTDYYFDMWIITNWRIIDIDLRGLFRLDIATILDLDHIQDIKTESIGVIQNLLGFGRIFVQTAATDREFEFDDAPNPRRIEQLIRDSQEELIQLKMSQGRQHHGN